MTGAAVDLDWLAGALTGEGRLSAVVDFRQLSGGASRQTFSYEGVGADAVSRRYILQVERPGGRGGVTMATQARLIAAAGAAGAPVARVLGHGVLPDGREWMISPELSGESIAKRILNQAELASARRALVREAATALAAIHGISDPALDEALELSDDPLAASRRQLDELGQPHPALELGLRWLDEWRPETIRLGPVHGDFRLGNLLVAPSGLTAVLDWELAHRGDPVEDLGWLCVRSWRFGGEAPAAGVGSRAELLEAYEASSGVAVDPEHLRWWEVFGTLRWGIICIMQAETHRLGVHRSLELAAIGRRVCETEYDLLEYLG